MSYSDDEELKIGDDNIEEDEEEIDLDLNDDNLDGLLDDDDLAGDELLEDSDEVAGLDGSADY